MDPVSPSATPRGGSRTRLSTTTAVHDLYECHYVRLVRLAVLFVGDAGRAEEIVQDAFVDLVARWQTIRDPGTAASYLRVCVAMVCLPSAASCGGQSTTTEPAGARSAAWLKDTPSSVNPKVVPRIRKSNVCR